MAHPVETSRQLSEASLCRELHAATGVLSPPARQGSGGGQVHKAVLRVGGEERAVAVKVRHPGVVTRITQDFQLLIPLARAASKFRALKVGRRPLPCPAAGCSPGAAAAPCLPWSDRGSRRVFPERLLPVSSDVGACVLCTAGSTVH